MNDPFEPASRIDRMIGDRPQRLMIGINLEDDLATLAGALIVVKGSGKNLSVVRSTTRLMPLSGEVSAGLHGIRQLSEPSVWDLRAIQNDLAGIQCSLVDEFKREAGKYVDRLLAISLSDPGLWSLHDELGRGYEPLGDPGLLAAHSGISVIDAFPIRDVIAGGTGLGLEALPAWILAADRFRHVAVKKRLLIVIRQSTTAFFLPPSDGLDDQLPDIQLFTAMGTALFQPIQAQFADLGLPELSHLNLQGTAVDELQAEIAANKSLNNVKTWLEKVGPANLVRTTFVSLVDNIVRQFQCLLKPRDYVDEIFVDCHPAIIGAVVNQFRQFCDVPIRQDAAPGGQPGGLCPVLVGLLGLLGLDQTPANVPAITGANGQRILGRISPGSPSNWRQLLREMADYQPPAMRLRDAV